MKKWVVPENSKKRVRRASRTIGEGTGTPEEIREAREVLSNYRLAHAFPLNAVTTTVRKRALDVNPNAVVAERRKRLPTILDKLKRHPTMSVTTMQDLGGCRVVFDTVAEVDKLVSILEELPRSKNHVTKVYDYLRDEPGPRDSGYRGVHLVYEYGASKTEYHGLKIELQVRTQLQHAWATAIETMDLFSGSELKYGKGDEELLRFFVLVGSLMAYEEGTTPVPSAEGTREELAAELARLEASVGVLERLQGYAAIVGEHAKTDRRNTLTLELLRNEGQLTVTVHETLAAAEARITELEALDDENLDAVLINIARISQLRDAYPNYFADTGRFTEFVGACL
ncbi:RelA/SpoT domain-containing protein [Streptomyces longhuiensis]|uniref:RelA/SpoT domain-containing protein n=1 Tax=Streptomyces longhuiensis TaxID=2880933 RepID=UPI001D0A1DC2|nr:RelA/SpoT domain-containing protein [Streptomyces longhuiensis]UDM00511.1 RelA/SpoT domain-containing protein [Streptomyces longhuiensis]